jgi:drug/metabolite transporter (DMT)-like permease
LFSQSVTAPLGFLLAASVTETMTVQWTGEFLFAVVWLGFVLSLGAIWLLYLMIRRQAATRVASLFYLTPAVTALMAWMLFDERLSPPALAGMAICLIGVALVNWQAAADKPQ